MRTIKTRGYHHGDLRRTIMDEAIAAITETGPSGWSLRELARRAGVSHAAPAHHFGDRTGLLTAIAAEGFDLLAQALDDAGQDLLDAGTAYVRFAATHRAHFEVMFRPRLYRADDPEVSAARTRSRDVLHRRLGNLPHRLADTDTAALAAWSIVHGFAELWLNGALTDPPDTDPAAAARPVISLLFDR